MHITIIGANGQVGYALKSALAKAGYNVLALQRQELDLANLVRLPAQLSQLPKTDCLINAAAYTAVDLAETERDLALAINASALELLSIFCHNSHIPLIHYSTDYVFNGCNTVPYQETDPTSPINHYGYTKLKGEQTIASTLPHHIIIRTSWVFGRHGKNFVKTILKLAQKKHTLNIVADQTGCPTSADDLARITTEIIPQLKTPNFNAWGLYHYASKPHLTWFALAQYSIERARELGLPLILETLNPIPTTEYPTPAKRPHYSILDTRAIEETFKIQGGQWHNEVDVIIEDLIKGHANDLHP